MPWLDAAALAPKLAGILKLSAENVLQGYWGEIMDDALSMAYVDIQQALAGRGFTQSQIDSWAGGPEYQRDLALWWALTKGGMLASESGTPVDDRLMMQLDRRAELLTVAVVDTTGNAPSSGRPKVTSGTMKSDRDTFIDPATGTWRRW
jgi:hypothetical protein